MKLLLTWNSVSILKDLGNVAFYNDLSISLVKLLFASCLANFFVQLKLLWQHFSCHLKFQKKVRFCFIWNKVAYINDPIPIQSWNPISMRNILFFFILLQNIQHVCDVHAPDWLFIFFCDFAVLESLK